MKRSLDGNSIIHIQLVDKVPVIKQTDSIDTIVDKKWMDHEEGREKHLVAAIQKKEPIPTPDVITIDDSIYNKIYPDTCKRPKWRFKEERK